jgi:hypothetical protein
MVVVVAVAAGLAGCGLFGGKHEVGECVRTQAGLGGTDIETADCPAAGSGLVDNIADPVYRITDVLDYDASCPNDGQWGIELKHEPDDAVYCLVPAV